MRGTYPTDTLAAVLAIAAALAALTSFFVVAVLHVLPTGLSPLRNAVSEYGISRFRDLYRLQAAAMGVAGLALAGAVARAVDPAPSRVLVLLVVYGCARIAIGWFPMDPIGTLERTPAGRMHRLLAAVAFVALPIAAVRLAQSLPHDGSHRPLVVLAWISVGCAVALAPTLAFARRVFGFAERVFYLACYAYVLAAAIELVRLTS